MLSLTMLFQSLLFAVTEKHDWEAYCLCVCACARVRVCVCMQASLQWLGFEGVVL